MPWEAWYTLAVVVALVAVLATARLSAPVAVMGAVAALVAPGVITTSTALAGFSNEAPVTIAALYVLAGAVLATGALDGVIARLLSTQPPASQRPGRLELTRLLAPVAALSAFIYNTPLTAMSAPPVAAWATRTGRRPSWYLLPLVPGLAVIMIGTAVNQWTAHPVGMGHLVMGYGLLAALVGAVFFAVWKLNQRGADRLQVQIDEMTALRSHPESGERLC